MGTREVFMPHLPRYLRYTMKKWVFTLAANTLKQNIQKMSRTLHSTVSTEPCFKIVFTTLTAFKLESSTLGEAPCVGRKGGYRRREWSERALGR